MRRLSLSDTVFYNLGDCYITAAFVLDGPCDTTAMVAEIEGVVAELPAMSERPRRIGVWTFAERAAPFDPATHVAIVRDPMATSIDHLADRIDRLRRSPIPKGRPPWRMFILNPDGSAGSQTGAAPLSALLIQGRHGLGDAMRGIQLVGRMGRHPPDSRHRAIAAALPVIDLAALPATIAVHDVGLSFLQVPRRGMHREGDASERLAAAAAAAVADVTLFPHARPLRGNVGRTHLVRRRVSAEGLGNHLKMITVRTGAGAARRWRIPGLARAQELELTTWLVALAPRWLARLMMRIWYSSFDAMATLLPLQRQLVVGGRRVTAAFGVPPLWGPVPLVLIALADGEHYHITVLPGTGFTASRTALHQAIGRLLNPEAAGGQAVAGIGSSGGEARRPFPARYGQGADGNISSPVSVPASVKSP